MKRLFAFGCSFTNYRWLTWADILGLQWEWFQNWGQSGAGNHYIFNAMMECDQRHQWNQQDTVLVCWTNVMRDDRYFEGRGWITLGNIADAKIYSKEFLADGVSQRGNLLRDIALIKAAKTLVESRKVNWKFLQMCDIMQPEPWDPRKMTHVDIVDLYQDVFECLLPSYMDVLGNQYWQHRKDLRSRYPDGGVDYHPMPTEHLEYLDSVLPGWVHDPAVRRLVSQNDMTPSRKRIGANQNHRL